MDTAYAEREGDTLWRLGNELLTMELEAGQELAPRIAHLTSGDLPRVDWAIPGAGLSLGPVLEIGGERLAPGAGLTCTGVEAGSGAGGLCLHYAGPGGLAVHQHLAASPDKPVWTGWTELENRSDEAIDGIVD